MHQYYKFCILTSFPVFLLFIPTLSLCHLPVPFVLKLALLSPKFYFVSYYYHFLVITHIYVLVSLYCHPCILTHIYVSICWPCLPLVSFSYSSACLCLPTLQTVTSALKKKVISRIWPFLTINVTSLSSISFCLPTLTLSPLNCNPCI